MIFAVSTGVTSPGSLAALCFASSPDSVDDHGVLVLSLAGQKIGTEKFEISSSEGQVEAKAEIQLRFEQDGKMVESRTFPDLVLNSKFQPLTYTWRQKGSQVSQLQVDFRPSLAKCRYRTVTGEDDERDFDLPKDVVVLDDNVFHHYQLVVRRLRLAPQGKQTFKAFIPQETLPGVLTVEDVGAESVEIGGHAENLQHLVVTTELARVDLWVDDQQRLQRLTIPTALFEAVRKR